MFSLYSVLVLAITVSAASLAKRDVATVLTNLETIDTQTESLTSAINAWDASLLGALGVQQDVTNLEVCYGRCHNVLKTDKKANVAGSLPSPLLPPRPRLSLKPALRTPPLSSIVCLSFRLISHGPQSFFNPQLYTMKLLESIKTPPEDSLRSSQN